MHYSKCNIGYVVRAEIGEEIQEALRQFAQTVGLKGAFYSGIGTLTQVELAFFRSDTKHYDRRFFDGDYGLISLTGNLSVCEEGIPILHTHACLGDRLFNTYSGHLVRGVVSITAEIIVVEIDLALSRQEDPILSYHGLISPNRHYLKIDS